MTESMMEIGSSLSPDPKIETEIKLIKSASTGKGTGKIGRIVFHRYGEFYFFEHFRLWEGFSSILARFYFRIRA